MTGLRNQPWGLFVANGTPWSRTVEPEAAQAPGNPVAIHARLARVLSAYGRVALPVGKTRFEKREGKGWADRMGEGACSFKLHGFRG